MFINSGTVHNFMHGIFGQNLIFMHEIEIFIPHFFMHDTYRTSTNLFYCSIYQFPSVPGIVTFLTFCLKRTRLTSLSIRANVDLLILLSSICMVKYQMMRMFRGNISYVISWFSVMRYAVYISYPYWIMSAKDESWSVWYVPQCVMPWFQSAYGDWNARDWD